MFDGILVQWIHAGVSWLLEPVIAALALLVALAIWEIGQTLGEGLGGIRRLREAGNAAAASRVGRGRIERADLIARVGPMLGLMGTLIPLGPGLAALGRGELQTLAQAVTVAFDTTVTGLLVGIIGFILGRVRRRWYDHLLDTLEGGHGRA